MSSLDLRIRFPHIECIPLPIPQVHELQGTLETVQNQRNELRQQLKDEKVEGKGDVAWGALGSWPATLTNTNMRSSSALDPYNYCLLMA